MAAVLRALRAVDFYRNTDKKDNADTTESMFGIKVGPQGSLRGVVLSFCTLALMGVLILAEFRSYLTVGDKYDVVLAGSGVGALMALHPEPLEVNFNVSFPHLPCKFASVDVHDVTHTRRLNVTKDIRKFYLGKSGRIVGEEQHPDTEREGGHEVLADDHPIHARMANPNVEDHSQFLTDKTYDDYVKKHDVVLVNFFAPWCHWCRRFEPVWEHTAGELKNHEYRNTVSFARVNCVEEEPLCRRHLIRAYPTVLTYQQGKTDLTKMYRGDRSTKALLEYVEHLQFVADRIKSGKWDHAEAAKLAQAKHDPTGESEGCMVTGRLKLRRVPGSVVFTAHSEWHNFDAAAIDVSHAVNHFSFGKLARRSPRLMPNTASLDGTVMDALGAKRMTHHHYMKIVETFFEGVYTVSPIDIAKRIFFPFPRQVYTYQFTKHSHSYTTPKGIAQAKFQFDIDPMAVKVSEVKTSTFRFITSLCAIVGGAYAVMGIIDGTLFRIGA